MAKFSVNWNLDGFRDKLHTAGAVIEADLKEVEQFVAKEFGGLVHLKSSAVLTPVSDDTPITAPAIVPGSDVDLSQLTKTDLITHADEYHDLTIAPTTSKPNMIAQIEEARAAALPVEAKAAAVEAAEPAASLHANA